MKIALAQMRINENKDDNLKKTLYSIETAAKNGANLIIVAKENIKIVVNPNGDIVLKADEKEELTYADIEMAKVKGKVANISDELWNCTAMMFANNLY